MGLVFSPPTGVIATLDFGFISLFTYMVFPHPLYPSVLAGREALLISTIFVTKHGLYFLGRGLYPLLLLVSSSFAPTPR